MQPRSHQEPARPSKVRPPEPEETGVIARIAGGDRRQVKRKPHVARVIVTVLDESGIPTGSLACMSHNLSRDGMAFSIRQDIPIGAHVIIETPSAIPGRNISLYGVVRQLRRVSHDSFVVGVSFEDMPIDPGLADWLAARPTLQDE
jgi:hypothetical protein